MRWLRLAHYILMLIFGAAIAICLPSINPTSEYNLISINLILSSISIIFSALFSIIINNISDINIDKISNKSRPLVTGSIPLSRYKKIATVSLLTSMIFSYSTSWAAFIIINLVIGIYYLYSMPPIRFKRLPVFSKLAISTNSLLLIMLGYILVKNNLKEFPLFLIPIYLIGFTISANFIDIKDYRGDLINGIKTLPVIIGFKKTFLLVSLAFFLNYLSFYMLLKNYVFLMLLFIGGIIQLLAINKKPYNEKLIFITYLSGFILLNIVLFLNKVYTIFPEN